ncbi:hypothetical protein PIB30_071316 [Stylosanthes scabra]|uniref:Uncharacterized protein n=1 Tax=Stylosanthes scabra TaxID=79078 RepID=A0ABU6XLX7_9FABA|nr:hypothetical protein [Stylosanthes scabra]
MCMHRVSGAYAPMLEGKMKKGSLRSKKRSLEAILGKSSTHSRSGRICVQALSHPRLGIPDQA